MGVTSIQLDDQSRPDPESPLGVRSLLTEIWYPAEDEASTAMANKFSEFVSATVASATFRCWKTSLTGGDARQVLRGTVAGSIPKIEKELSSYGREVTVELMDREWHNVGVRDARVRGSGAPAKGYPLVVFSHGNSATRFGYTYLCEMLASWGYIVVSPDHTGNCRFTFLDGKFVPMGGPRNGTKDSPTAQSAVDRPHDISFLIDEIERLNSGADCRFTGRVNCAKVGVSGGSFGGYTTMAAAEIDARIAAVMPLVAGGPLPLGETRTNTSTPAMVLVGAKDATVDNRFNRRYYDETTAPKFWIELTEGGHMSVNSINQYNKDAGNGIGLSKLRDGSNYTAPPPAETHAIVNAYMLAFFDRFIKGITANDAFLSENHFGDAVIYAFER